MVRTKRVKRAVKRKTRRMKGGNVPTFHVLIVTAGRTGLIRMLDSLKPQLRENDAITIVFDGKHAKKKSTYKDDFVKDMKCKVTVIEQVPGLKAYGHGSMNKYLPDLKPETTYVMFADDDDHYLEGAFDALRKSCIDPDILYVAKMRNNGGLIPPDGTREIGGGKIGKPCGIIPFKDRAKSKLGETGYAGDLEYYHDLKTKVKGLAFLEDIIYEVEPQGNVNGNVE